VKYSDSQWKRICEILSKTPVTGFFENFAFYNPQDEVLYMNEKMIRNHPQKIISVCAHELSEKLLSTYLSSSLETPMQAIVKMYEEARKTGNPKKFYEFMDAYVGIVFKSVFKEGCCEAMALQTLRSMGYEIEVASLEKELHIGHSKCIGLLFDVDNARRNPEGIRKIRMRSDYEKHVTPAAEEQLTKALKWFQIIKGVSYYLGYPLAKAVLEKYGVKGVKLALEKHPPLRAQYFANSQAYLTRLEKSVTAFQ